MFEINHTLFNPLCIASALGNLEIVEFLVENGANVNGALLANGYERRGERTERGSGEGGEGGRR